MTRPVGLPDAQWIAHLEAALAAERERRASVERLIRELQQFVDQTDRVR